MNRRTFFGFLGQLPLVGGMFVPPVLASEVRETIRVYAAGGSFETYVISRQDGMVVQVLEGLSESQGGKVQKWYVNNVLHRVDGPAHVDLNHGYSDWYFNGQHHRTDGPAMLRNGDKYWYQYGLLHREDGPAVEQMNGTREWYLNGERHRDGGPAIISKLGNEDWYQHGQLHRVDGPASTETYHNGNRYSWYLNGKRHRDDGPAVEHPDGGQGWYQHGKLHRVNGPAIIRVSESSYNGPKEEWFIDGKKVDPLF